MRMSVTTTSGCSASIAAQERVAVAAGGHHLDSVRRVEHVLERLADEIAVVRDHDADRRRDRT